MLGGGISRLGDVLTGLAFLFLAYELTESNWHTTGIVIAETVPYLFFGLIGGVVSDWVKKKKLLIVVDLIRVPIVFSVVIFDQLGLLSYTYLLIVGFIVQSLGSVFNPAHRAVLPLITSTDERTAANSLLDTLTRGVTILGPAVSVLFLNTVGVIHFFTFDAFTYLISALLVSRMSLKESNVSTSRKKITDIFSAIYEFAVWTVKEKTMSLLFALTFMTVFCNTWVWQVGILLSMQEVTDQADLWYSTIQSWFGFIGIAVSLVIPLLWKTLTLTTYRYGSLIWGVGLTCLGFAYGLPSYFVGVLIVAMGMPLASLSRVFLIQQIVPEDKLGRGFSFNGVLLYLSNVISLSFFGLLSTYIPIRTIFFLCGILTVIATLASFGAKIARRSPVNLSE